MTLKPCGTDAAYQRHMRRDEYCAECWDAHSKYVLQLREEPTYRRMAQRYQRLSNRVMSRLVDLHPVVYQALYLEEKESGLPPRRARVRALTRLKGMHPAMFRVLFDEEEERYRSECAGKVA